MISDMVYIGDVGITKIEIKNLRTKYSFKNFNLSSQRYNNNKIFY